MKAFALVLAILITKTIQVCNPGCLLCSTTNSCVFCDASRNYYLSSNSCVLSIQTNCNFISQNGNCLQCNPNFYLDLNSQKCLQVLSLSIITNCLTYTSNQACSACNQPYYLSAGGCIASNITVDNCAVYSANGVCSQCNIGFIFSNDFSRCQVIPTSANCLSYTYVICTACNTQTIMNYNNYVTNFQNQNFLTQLLFTSLTQKRSIWSAFQVCQGINIQNCATYSSFQSCASCISGYYLSNGNCIVYPLPVINYCLTYVSLTACGSCIDGFYLYLNKCLPNKNITNCVAYDSSMPVTTCFQCNPQTFLLQNNCMNRTVSQKINNCAVLSVTSDTCSSCSNGYQITNDGLACLAIIANCLVYSSSNANSGNLKCSTCANNYYLNSTSVTSICLTGTIQNCNIYSLSVNTCGTCNNGYYLSNNLCIPHVPVQNCMTYSQSQMNSCSICNSGFYSFMYKTVCTQVPTINFCASYSSNGLVCQGCVSGYYLSGQTCLPIPSTLTNCLAYSGTACTLCGPGFMLNSLSSTSQCIVPFDYLTSSCVLNVPTQGTTSTWSATTLNTLSCMYCSSSSYSIYPSNSESICVLTTQLTMYAGFVTVAQCKRYGLNYASSAQIVCMECIAPYFISGFWGPMNSSPATSCISSCSTSSGTNIVIPDDLFGFVNICIPTGFQPGQIQTTTCQRFVRTTSFNKSLADFQCIQSTTGNILMYSNSVNGYPYEQNTQSPTVVAILSNDYYHGFATSDVGQTFPAAMNYHGMLLQSVSLPTNLQANYFTNCDIIWTIGGGSVKGSAYASSTGTTQAFAPFTTPQNSCLRCSFGFQATFQLTSVNLSAGNNVAVPTCVNMGSLCASSVINGGLPSFLNAMLSCHSCTNNQNSQNYPTIFMEFDAVSIAGNGAGNFLQYSLPSIIGPGSVSSNGFVCGPSLSPIATSSSAPSNNQVVSNCAVFGVLSAVTISAKAPSSGNIFNYCLACSTNFYPIYFGNPGSNVGISPTFAPSYAVQQCIPSANCNTPSTYLPFNSCASCNTAQASLSSPLYYAFTDFKLINCLQSNSKNCFILTGNLAIGVPNVCGVCMSGYFLNIDKVCEQIQIPNASVGASFTSAYYSRFIQSYQGASNLNFDSIPMRIHYLLSASGLRYGVSGCNNLYSMAPVSLWAPSLCVQSGYLTSLPILPQTTLFVQNCVNYSFGLKSNSFLCYACSNGFIPTSDGLNCVSAIANCLIAQTAPNTGSCNTCSNGYLNVYGNCAKPSFPNCLTFLNTATSFTAQIIQCNVCAPGYYLSSDGFACLAGSVMNCAVYMVGSATKCQTCASNFVLLTIANSINYCYPIPASLNCNSLQDPSNAGPNTAFISCTSCSASNSQVYGQAQFITSSIQAQTVCMPFNLVPNCIQYDQNSTSISLNSFACIACGTGYWYSSAQGLCVQRVNMPFQCLSYSVYSDICLACQTGTFLSSDSKSCITYPNGIFNCATYSSQLVCTSCNSGYFLSNNTCISSNIILNCMVYSANNTCAACNKNYYLANATTCLIAQAQNCVNYNSTTACQSCPTGYGLVTTNAITNCVFASVLNCAVPTTTYPFTCMTCAKDYYPNYLGNCINVGTGIPGCLTYDTNTTCIACSPNTVLSVSKTSCIQNTYSNYIDPNCQQSVLLGYPTCSMCKFGSYFVNGVCTTCNNTLIGQGCMSCDPNNSNNCLICSSGYYQNSTGSCLQIGAILNNGTNTVPLNNTNFTLNEFRTGVIRILAVLIFKYFV